jgi:membrane associated rhomboid family serine protease
MFGNNRDRRNGRGSPSPMLMLLLFQIFSQLEKLPIKPPITIALLFVNIWPHLMNVNVFGYELSNIHYNCLHPAKIMTSLIDGNGILFNRLVLSGIIHVDDSHLYYNMMSLCWKGINLENKMGSTAFLQLVVFSLLMSHSIMVILAYLLYVNTDFTSSYQTCAVGFSAVLFSLKYVWNHSASSSSNIMGINVPTKYAAWLELIVISVISPNVSFIGHLSGIIAGIIYIHGSSLIPRSLRFGLPSFDESGGGENTRYTYATGNLNTANRSSSSVPSAPHDSSQSNYGSQSQYHYEQSDISSSRTNVNNSRIQRPVLHTPSAPPLPADDYNVGENDQMSSNEIRRRRLQRFDK